MERKSAYEMHGESSSAEYRIWQGMIARCHRPQHPTYEWYGAKGVRVCEEWLRSFLSFKEHMGPRPSRYTVERINNAGHYEPGNVKWAPYSEQARNKSANHYIVANGERFTIADWAIRLGVTPGCIYARIRRGASESDAVTTPRCPSAAKSNSSRGISRGYSNARNQLSAEQAKHIVRLYNDGKSFGDVATGLNLSYQKVRRTIRRYKRSSDEVGCP